MSEREKRKNNGFMSGVLMLSLSAVIVKVIGLIYKIPMLRLLGSEGMGYFNSAYEIYTLFCTLATTGLPVAMSVLISSGRNSQKVFNTAIRLFALVGFCLSATMLVLCRPYAEFIGGTETLLCLVSISPAVLVICVSSTYRGFFQGHGKMAPTAISQMIEAGGKLVLGLSFAYLALVSGKNTPTVAAYAALGLTLGSILSAVYLVLAKKRANISEKNLIDEENKRILPQIVRIAIPVSLSSAIVSLTKVIDMTLILRRLGDTGFESERAFAAYGNYTTLALPLFGIAPAFVGAVALPLIPELSKAAARGDREGESRAVSDALRLTSCIAMPISVGLVLFSKPILELLFHGEYEAISTSAPLLVILGFSVVLSCLVTVTNAILQAYNSPAIPILSMTVGSVIKLTLAYLLIGNPQIGLLGAPISTFFCDLAINFVNFFFICKKMKGMPRITDVFLKQFFSAVLSVSGARLIYNLLWKRFGVSSANTLVSIAIAATFYAVLVFCTGALRAEDITFVNKKNIIIKKEE